MDLDKFDQKILELLRQNARIPVSQLAREVNLSRSAVAERINKLETNGTIQGYSVELANNSAGKLQAYFELTFKGYKCELEFIQPIRAIPEIKMAHGISGETDILLFVEVPNMERLHEIRAQLDQLESLVMLKTHMVMTQWFNDKFS